MKKAFLILTLLIAFNFTAPNNQALSQRVRHVVEYRQEDKSRDLTENEMLRNKVVMFMRMQMIVINVIRIDANFGFNTS
ncbi:MAG: hypothetical protein ABI543_04165 [Ignavibacteria bacterium]